MVSQPSHAVIVALIFGETDSISVGLLEDLFEFFDLLYVKFVLELVFQDVCFTLIKMFVATAFFLFNFIFVFSIALLRFLKGSRMAFRLFVSLLLHQNPNFLLHFFR